MGRNIKRWIGALLSIMIISNCGINAQATEALTPEQQYEQMLMTAYNKKIETNEIKDWPQGPQIYGEAGIVMDMESGAILYGKGIDEKHYPASITKILTALVALENSSMTDTVKISQESVDCLKYEYAHIGMKPGEEITMKDALYALMLASANEVAYAIGETVAGSHDEFVKMMNEKAKELGCKNTHFINTNGIFSEEHYTSARDMALISKAAFSHQELLDIVQTLQYTIPPTNMETESRTFQQKHKMLLHRKEYDERCIGGKTGYTDEAGNTLVTVMEQDGRRIVAVILKSKKDTYPDTKKICDYGFDNFEEVSIASNEKSEKLCNIYPDACVTLPSKIKFKDLKWKMDDKGNLNYLYKNQLVGTTKASMKQKPKLTKVETKEKKSESHKIPIKKIVIIVVVILAIGIYLLYVYVAAVRKKKRMRQARYRRRLREQERRQRYY